MSAVHAITTRLFISLIVIGVLTHTASATEDLKLQGNLYYLPRIALLPHSLVVVELREADASDRGTLIAEQRQRLSNEQPPIPFELNVPAQSLSTGQQYVLRGAILSSPGRSWMTEIIPISPQTGTVDLGGLRLQPIENAAFGSAFHCGDTRLSIGALGADEWMMVANEVFDLEHAPSASGARYTAIDGSDTEFWGKGDRAYVRLRGETLPECQAIMAPELPLRAWGHEPSWMIRIDDAELRLITQMGMVEQQWPRPEPYISASGIRYSVATEKASLTLVLQPEICRDSAVGMPHPYQALYTLEGESYSGCAGEPGSLLMGEEWQIDSIAGQPLLNDSTASIQFLPEQRVAGSASCNRFIGGYELTGEGLYFTQLGSTLMACEEPLLQQELELLTLLGEIQRFDISAEGDLLLYTSHDQWIRARRP